MPADIDILHPVIAMIGLTLLVCLHLYFVRVPRMIRDRIHPQKMATRRERAGVEISRYETLASDNLQNLFEVPIVFYVTTLLIHMMQLADDLFIGLAWAFVVTRALHSLVHCSYNKVTHRFMLFISGALILIFMFLRLAAQVFFAH
ncbi:MAG: MAPEG family protein [Gammaproteobacteria bacterium]|nr:MAPEG family protein [Gammaproteobacteria bacterium]